MHDIEIDKVCDECTLLAEQAEGCKAELPGRRNGLRTVSEG
jgi:hypothetical protein